MDYGIKFCVIYIYELSDFVGGIKVVRQGCRLIPHLFNVFLADFIYCIGVRYNDWKDIDTSFVVCI